MAHIEGIEYPSEVNENYSHFGIGDQALRLAIKEQQSIKFDFQIS
jgi:hypothetical protein